jgi:hypothetical protein
MKRKCKKHIKASHGSALRPSFILSLFLTLAAFLPLHIAEAGLIPAASTNLALDQQKVEALPLGQETLETYWTGSITDSNTTYITDILGPDALTFDLQVPDTPELYGSQAGQAIPYAITVFYPTTQNNPYLDYQLPGIDMSLPRMHPGSGRPMYLSEDKLYPLIIFSHGLYMHPLDERLLDLVRQGFIVAVVFHGDGRFPFPLLFDLHEIEQFSLRPLTLSACIDVVLNHPQLGPAIDQTRIGGVGVSVGGSALLALMGAEIVGPEWFKTRYTAVDKRMTVGVGIVPYMGKPMWNPLFGWDARGAHDVHAPFLAVSSAEDTIADMDMVQKVLSYKPGSRYLVQLENEEHWLSDEAVDSAFQWGLTFLKAHLKGNSAAQELLQPGTSLGGPVPNTLVQARPVPLQYNNDVFHWAEALLPNVLIPDGPTRQLQGILYRHYPANNIFLASYANELYWLDHTGVSSLGPVMYWWSALQTCTSQN